MVSSNIFIYCAFKSTSKEKAESMPVSGQEWQLQSQSQSQSQGQPAVELGSCLLSSLPM